MTTERADTHDASTSECQRVGEHGPCTPTAATVKSALHRKYNGADLSGEQYVCIEEARSGAGFDGNNGSCDFLAINTFHGRGMDLVGHEVKVALSDWKKELAEPEKAERFARFCHRWYVAVPSALASKIKDEVPEAWGLLSLSDKGRFTEVRKAPRRSPEPVPTWWWIGWMAQFDRQAKRRVPTMVNDALADERAKMRDRVKAEVDNQRKYENERNETLRANAEKVKTIVGMDLQHVWGHNLDLLRQAWALVKSGYDVKGLTINLRRTADALDGLLLLEEAS